MAENKLVKILKESTRRNNKMIENRLVEILKESLARNPSAGAPPAAQNLLKNKTVDDLVRILKNLTVKQKNAIAQTGPPPVVAAVVATGAPLPENKTPDELVKILKETLNSNLPKPQQIPVGTQVMGQLGGMLKTTGSALSGAAAKAGPALSNAAARIGSTFSNLSAKAGPALSAAAVRAWAATQYGAEKVVNAVIAATGLLQGAGLKARDQLAVLRKVPAIHREWMVPEIAHAGRRIPGLRRTVSSRPPLPKFGSGLFSRPITRMATNGQNAAAAAAAAAGGGGLAPAPSLPANVNWQGLRRADALINARKKFTNAGKNVPAGLNKRLSNVLKSEVQSLGYNAGPERIRKYMGHFKNYGTIGNWRYDLIDRIREKVDSISRESSTPQRAKEKLRDFKTSIGVGYYGGNSNVTRIFMQAERNLNRRLNENKRRRMNENRNKRGLPPLPAPAPRNNYRPNNVPPVFRPPANQPLPVFTPPPNKPALNMGEVKAINNVGGPNKALNLVQNAGGANNVLKAANQIKEFGDPVAAIAHGANAKNVKIVLQLGGANNAAKVATAAPKLRRRRRVKKTKKTKGKGRPKVSAIKKLLRSLPKKKLLAVLPKSNKASMANKNKANVATRVTSYLSGRTKAKK
jgi:hypothetical protein